MGPLTKKQWKKYKRLTKSHICYKPFTLGDPKVRDHCHYTGLYRGPAHSLCNLRYKIPSYITVVFHNLSGYDAHLFIRELGAHTSDMEVIAKNKADYISFSIKVPVDSFIDKNGEEKDKLIELRFIDSFKFMSSSLDSLTKNLVKGGKKLFGFEDYSELQYDLLTRKGVYPYDYVNSWDRFNETQLPPIDAFYSNLNMSSISEEDYQHAQRVWKEFGIRDLGDYHDLYLRTDVALLANVFEAFRDTSLRHYTLDPAHFYTSPGLAWRTCLKRTGIRKHRNIKLVTTEEKYLHTVMKPNFKSGVLFGENLMGCEMGKIKVVMKKPVYLGQAILDLSKIVMYEFHYDYMVPKYGLENLKLCYMDTDSLVYDIKTEDFYEDIANDVEARFDTSGCSKTDVRPLPISLNKKVIGLMKDELGGKIMTEFVALRPKLYSYKVLDGSEHKKCKGIKKCVVKKTLTFEDYKTCLFSDSTEYRSQLMFRSAKHEVHTIDVNKVALNRDDDKRISKEDGISTFARGHKDLSWSPTLGELSLR